MELNGTKLLTKQEIAGKYGVSEGTIDAWMRDGRIAFHRTPSGRPRFLPPEQQPEGLPRTGGSR